MAITDIKQYAHLTEADVEELARELDAIRTDIEESRGERDARYVRRTIQLQRALAAGQCSRTASTSAGGPQTNTSSGFGMAARRCSASK